MANPHIEHSSYNDLNVLLRRLTERMKHMVENKEERSRLLKILLMNAPVEGFKIEDIVRITGEKYRDINYALSKMDEQSLKTPSYGHYRYEPTQEEIEFAKAVMKTVKQKK